MYLFFFFLIVFVFLLKYPVIMVSILQRVKYILFLNLLLFFSPSMDCNTSINISSVTGIFFWTVFTAMYILQRLQQFTYIEFILYDEVGGRVRSMQFEFDRFPSCFCLFLTGFIGWN